MASSDWKSKNYNKNVKVSQKTVSVLKSRSKAENIAAANRPGASPELREAVKRFYGKGTVKSFANQGKITRGSKGAKPTVTATRQSVSKPKSGKTSNMSPAYNQGSPSAKLNTGTSNLSPAQRKAIAARQSKVDKAITFVAQAALPGTGAVKGAKAAVAVAKYGKFAARNLATVKTGVRLGTATKGELKDAQRLADAIAKRKQQLRNAPAAKPAAKPAPKVKPKAEPKPKAAPKSKPAAKPAAPAAQKMAKDILDTRPKKLGKKSVVATGAAYVSKKYREQD